jgi:hypothetical protein
MAVLDQYARTFLPAAAESGVGLPGVSRHMPIFQRCVGLRDKPILLARCYRTDEGKIHRRRKVLLLTRLRLVVTTESRLLRRLRLHLNCELRHLADVTWTPEPTLGGVTLAATAVDGVRERFWVDAGSPERVQRVDTVLRQLFAAPAQPVAA